jgi:hypothetical protein
MSPHRIVGQRCFVDGITRLVCADEGSQRCVLEDGEGVDGPFLLQAEDGADAR